MTAAPTLDSPRTRHSAAAVAVLFFVNGATFSNWLPRIPEIRDDLGLGNAGLGVTLLGGGLGGIVGALVVGRVMDRLGSRSVLTIAATCLSIGMPLIAFAPTAWVLLLLLTSLGVLDVCNDVAMNAQGVIVQQRLGRS
ncbi:MAG TPA: MFS transporter, partial [Ilumatobacteraceae bacterium]|nr:MFS transporter [Ilumatobacteraceae bacterium]